MAEQRIDEKTRDIFTASYRRCTANRSFLQRFYEIFVSSDPQVAAKFADTDMRKQARMVQISLGMLLEAADGKPEGKEHLARMARVHGRKGADIPEHMYETWLQSLLKAVREYDPQCNRKVEQAWEAILRPSIEYMIAHRE